jgi:hypothetical protein
MEIKTVKCFVGRKPDLIEAEITTIAEAIFGDFWCAYPVSNRDGICELPVPATFVLAKVSIKGWEVERIATIPPDATDEQARKILVAAANRMWRMISS